MRRFLLLSCLILAMSVAALAGGPALAGALGGEADPPPETPSPADEGTTTEAAGPESDVPPPDTGPATEDGSDAAVADPPPTDDTTADESAEPASTEAPPATPDEPEAKERHVPERTEELRLHCKGVVGDGRHGVACEWSKAAHPKFAGYQLIRGDGEQRVVVFRTRDRAVTRFFDQKVEPGVRYHYLIQEVNADGRVIGSGGPIVAGIPEREHEKLRLSCERAAHDGMRGITCGWSEAQRDDARGYVLYRSIDHGERQAIHRVGIDGPNRYFDAPLRPGHRYTYAVVLLDGDGEVIGGGGPVTVGIPPPAEEPER